MPRTGTSRSPSILAADLRPRDDRDAALGEPLDQAADGLHGLRLVRLDQNPDASNRSHPELFGNEVETVVRAATHGSRPGRNRPRARISGPPQLLEFST